MKYSLWYIVHESAYRVSAEKAKDTNSSKEVDKWVNQDPMNRAGSFYREEDELNADYLQTFSND